MAKFLCCGVVASKRKLGKDRAVYEVQDTWQEGAKIGVEAYSIYADWRDDIATGDTVFCAGEFEDGERLKAAIMVRIGVLLVNNLLVSFASELNIAEELWKDADFKA